MQRNYYSTDKLIEMAKHRGYYNLHAIAVGISQDTGLAVSTLQSKINSGHFSREEDKEMEIMKEKAADAVECILREGADRAMNVFNTPPEKKAPLKRSSERKTDNDVDTDSTASRI